MSVPYGPIMMEHFRRPKNRGSLASPSITEEATNPLCGDRVRIELRVEGDMVKAARFTANACAICVAASSVMTELIHNAPLDEVETLMATDLLQALRSEVPATRLGCVTLPLTVLHAAVMLYRRRAQPEGTRA